MKKIWVVDGVTGETFQVKKWVEKIKETNEKIEIRKLAWKILSQKIRWKKSEYLVENILGREISVKS